MVRSFHRRLVVTARATWRWRRRRHAVRHSVDTRGDPQKSATCSQTSPGRSSIAGRPRGARPCGPGTAVARQNGGRRLCGNLGGGDHLPKLGGVTPLPPVCGGAREPTVFRGPGQGHLPPRHWGTEGWCSGCPDPLDTALLLPTACRPQRTKKSFAAVPHCLLQSPGGISEWGVAFPD